MKNLFFCLLVLLTIGSCKKETSQDLTNYVDLMIGTDATGNMFPGPSTPFGGVQLSPDTYNDGCCSGYHYTHNSIIGFSHTHLSGTGCADYGDVLFMPAVGEINIMPGTAEDPDSGYRSRFSHDKETTSPGYYSVLLDDYDVKVELTTTPRVGFHKYTFPASAESHIILDLEHDITAGEDPKDDCFIRVISNTEIEGLRHSRGWASDQYVYFVAQFSEPFTASQIYLDNELQQGTTEVTGKVVKAAFKYETKANQAIMVKVGISAVSVDGARKNLEAELPHWDFDAIVRQTKAAWNKELNTLKVEGGTADQKTKFYTALYHALLTPNLYMDVDGQYRGMDHQVHEAVGFTNYSVFSLWDTYRALHPLINLISPERNEDFIKTMLKQYEHSGLLPVWELSGCENNCMIGYHSVPVIVDTYLKGNQDFDIEKALEAMLTSGAQNSEGIQPYRDFEFIPRDKSSNSVSKVLEYAYDDWCIAQFAKSIGNTEVYNQYIKRAQYYKNMFDPSTGLMRPRYDDGTWVDPFDPLKITMLDGGDYTEANAWQYSFYVPHDVTSHIELMGGDEKYISKLDTFFTLETKHENAPSDFVGLFGQYAHGNEPGHHMPYLYNYAGAPWKGQELIRKTMQELYTTKPDGLCGNDDCGQLSAWYLFSAMGFYPVCPGQDMYVFGSPVFDKVTLSLPNGKLFVVQSKNASDENMYVQSTTLNGQDYPYSYISHTDILKGGTLIFEMGATPNKDWGAKKENRPYSLPIEAENQLKPLGTGKIFNPFVETNQRLFYDHLSITLGCISEGVDIHYTLDGSEPDQSSPKYSGAFDLTETATLKAKAFKEGFEPSGTASHEFLKAGVKFDGTYPKVTYLAPASGKDVAGDVADGLYAENYTGGGVNGLIDGKLGSFFYNDGTWQGFSGKDMEVVLDLGKPMSVNRVTAGFLQSLGVWIFHPVKVEFFISGDGKAFDSLGSIDVVVNKESGVDGVRYFSKEAKGKKARYIKVHAHNIGFCPEWHHGAGGKAWLFADEVVVE
ncbi:MAG: GH92 family glycosyl hydrolase [Saprospiraceae bacterium]|nr:GH92 family glycosyl hydrolase [Saprospiraceae bacterium]MCB9324359.1 glycoside hydrolase family 92 protein [Lewinellaceae bacterium]